MATIITILHVIVCLFLIFVVLLQAGKGGGMGLAFGGSNAGQVFGGSGAGNFLTRLTAITAVMFMLTSLTLAFLASARESNWLEGYEKRAEAQAKREAALKQQLVTGDAGPVGATPVVVPGDKPGDKVDDKVDEKVDEKVDDKAPEAAPTKSEAPKSETKPAENAPAAPKPPAEKAPPK